ncbi:hypothetical protein D3C71_1944180 [compost metagenome]
MKQHAGALNMAEEAVAETDPFMRPFDQTRNISKHEFAPINRRNAEIGVKRRKRIIGDLRSSTGD